ncbi:endonuclease SmrB [Buchnera aphidicola]|uniref:endonuclease SmrB n=1 Tax=Buchnera aphidicola TaxID=9 RepID=UPI003BEEEA31
MNKNRQYTTDDNTLFRQYLTDTREIIQDTIFHSRIKKTKKNNLLKRIFIEQKDHIHYFTYKKSKKYFFQKDPVSYVRNKNSYDILKNLKKDRYYPDIFLDLHGFTQYQAQQELGQLIRVCKKEKIFCAHIMHGYGKCILKQQIPFWLSQHPDIIAFHQASKIFGSNAAIIVIIEI